MGGHYGAIHVRTEDHAAILAAVEAISSTSKLKFYIGPPLRGWIGVYPQKNGQDIKVSAKLAEKLDTDMLHLIVHDDSVFAYVFYQHKKDVDRYDSCPKYFDDNVPEHEIRATEGKPEQLAHLLKKPHTVAEAKELLRRRDIKEEVFVRDRAVRFAALFDIPNAIEAYEYLKEEETEEEIEQWKKFTHVPDPKLEQQAKRRVKEELQGKIAALKQSGVLHATHSNPDLKQFGVQPNQQSEGLLGKLKKSALRVMIGGQNFPARPNVTCDKAHNRFLVVWGIMGGSSTPLLTLENPWTEFKPTGVAVSADVHELAASASGRFLAVGCASGNWNTELYDIQTKKLIKQIPANRVVSSVGFTTDESALLSVSESKWELVSTQDGKAISSGDAPAGNGHALLRSDGTLIVEANGNVGLFDLATGTLTWKFYLGGKYSMAAMMSQGSEKIMKQVEEQLRKAVPPEELEARKQIAAEELRKKLDETRQKMESALKQVGAGKLPEHDHGMNPAFALAFNADESQLFAGTHRGCLVFDWSDVRASANPQPRTVIEPQSTKDRNTGNYVYSLAFDRVRNLLLIGGIGKLHYYDPASGKSGVLLNPPAPTSFVKLCLSPDRSALACACAFMPDRENRNAQPAPELQIWNYPVLLKEAGLA